MKDTHQPADQTGQANPKPFWRAILSSIHRLKSNPLRALLIGAALALPAYFWTSTRLTGLQNLLRENRPIDLGVIPFLMSAAVGPPSRPVGYLDDGQAAAFSERGGRSPLSGLDIRTLPTRGTPRLLWEVDPGISFLWNLASRFGLPLTVRSLITLQVGVDFVALVLAMCLAGRSAGWFGAAMAGILYGKSLSHAQASMLPCYYYWSIPVALLVAYVTTSGASRRWAGIIWSCGAVVLSCALWLRLLWFPVGVAYGIVYALLRPRARWKSACLLVALLALSYSMTVLRASSVQGGDVLHPRSQLWHTLYIGLGYYGTFGEIRWLDGYAGAKGLEAGIDPSTQQQAYDRYMRTLFLRAVRSAPLRYLGILVRRFGEYFDFGRFFAFGDHLDPGRFFPLKGRFAFPSATRGFLFLLVVGGAAVILERGNLRTSPLVQVGCLYVIIVTVWTILVPPQYAAETTGLVTPLVGAVVATGARRTMAVVTHLTRVGNRPGTPP